MVRYSKWVVFAMLATALACIGAGVLNAARPQQNTLMHVQDVEIFLHRSGPFRATVWSAATVVVVDQDGQPVGGVTVSGTFTDCDGNSLTANAKTDREGIALLGGKQLTENDCRCEHTFTVTNVTKKGATYDDSHPDNVTSDTGCLCICG